MNVAYNTFVQIFSKAVTVVFGITTTALLTNYLGPTGFGEYLFVLSYVAIFSGVADWGTVLISVREASRKINRQNQIFASSIALRFCLSLLAMIVSMLTIRFFPGTKNLQNLIILSSVLILLMNLKTSMSIIFQTKLRLEKIAQVDLLASLATLVLTSLFIRLNGNVFLFVGGVIFANLIAIFLAIFLAGKMVNFSFHVSWETVKEIGLEALPLGGVLALFSIYNRLDTVILQAVKGSNAVGVYGLSYRIYEVLVLGAFYLTNSLFPLMAKEKNKKKFVFLYQKTLDVLIIAGLFVFLLTFLLAPLAIKIIVIQKSALFFQSIPLLQILGLACFFSYLNHLTGATLIVFGEQKKYLLISVFVLVFNLLANLFFIPAFSFYAAAWITVATEGLVFCLTSLMVYHQTKIIPNFLTFPKTFWEIIVKKGKIF